MAKFRDINNVRDWLCEKSFCTQVEIRKFEQDDSWAPIRVCLDDLLVILCGGDARLVLGVDLVIELINAGKLQFYAPHGSTTPLVMGTPHHCIAIILKYAKTGRFIHQFKLMFDRDFADMIEREWLSVQL